MFELTETHVDELDTALRHAESVADDVLDITVQSFPLPTLGPELARITRELIEGTGVALIRGVPVDRYSKERASSIGARAHPRSQVRVLRHASKHSCQVAARFLTALCRVGPS